MKLKGSYSSLTTYDVGDVVKYTDGNVYHLQKPCKAGVPPVETLYWGKIEQGLAEAIGYVLDMMDAESGENEKLKKAVLDIVLPLLAPAYSKTATYAVGDHCIHDNKYYVCSTTISTAEDWTAAHWTQKTLGGEIAATDAALTAAAATIPDNIDADSILLNSSTASSTKQFLITVDDDGEVSAEEVPAEVVPAEEVPAGEGGT